MLIRISALGAVTGALKGLGVGVDARAKSCPSYTSLL